MRILRSYVIWLTVASSAVLVGQDVGSPDASGGKAPSLEWNGNLDVKYTLFRMQERSPLYTLQYPTGKPSTPLLTHYRLEPYLNAEYRTMDLGFSLRTHATYVSDSESSFDLFEAYGTYSPSFNTTLQAGKRVYNWGKGYAFNPVGVVNPVKDPENPELAQAGLLSASVEYVRSFSSDALQNVSFLFVVIPSSDGDRFGEFRDTELAFRGSLLIWDTDIDLIGRYGLHDPRSIGLDVARNVSENLEVHGELAYSTNRMTSSIVNNSLVSRSGRGLSYLIGLRYLHETNITLIAEYYHNEFGLDAAGFGSYYRFLTTGAQSSDPDVIRQTARLNQTNFRGSTLMKDYVYLKLLRPEPFDWLYFTPSLFTIYNVADKSFLLSASLNYKPATNVEFILWPSAVFGGESSEYGSKAFQQKVEVWMRVFF